MLPHLKTSIPGPLSQEEAKRLRQYECRNTTYLAEDWPIFWEKAKGCHVWDVDGNRFLDVTSAFAVAGLGHTNPEILEGMQSQASLLMHGMGDVHPNRLKAQLCEQLSRITFERWGLGIGKTILSSSGFEAVESALKTATVWSGKPEILAFEKSYHGLGYGALLATGLECFRRPVSSQLSDVTHLFPFPVTADEMEAFQEQLALSDLSQVGAVIVEPIQGRGGKVVPHPDFLPLLRIWCDENGSALIFDEIYSGFNRTGEWFACDHEEVFPDFICLGKALSGGYPISACVGRSALMDAWPESSGEALHTSTFLGNPVGCAMALVALKLHSSPELKKKVAEASQYWRKALEGLISPLISEVRGRGLMLGVELRHPSGAPAGDVVGPILSQMLQRGVVMLADGPDGNVLALTPPFKMEEEEIDYVIDQLQELLVQFTP